MDSQTPCPFHTGGLQARAVGQGASGPALRAVAGVGWGWGQTVSCPLSGLLDGMPEWKPLWLQASGPWVTALSTSVSAKMQPASQPPWEMDPSQPQKGM